MSKLLENKQLIHIAAEIILFVGVTFYFSSKTRKLQQHIDDLSQKLEEQQDTIQKHEQIIRQLIDTVRKIQQPINTHVVNQPINRINKNNNKRNKDVKFNAPPPLQQLQQQQTVEIQEREESSSEEEDSDLDAELENELNDLNNDSSIDLKKST
jgi:hypothetical protein